MKKLVFAILAVMVLAQSALSWIKNEDINRDGVKEKIVWQEQRRESYYIASMTISRKGKIVFQENKLKTTAMDESAVRIADVDPRYSGSEVIVIRPSDTAICEGDAKLVDERCYKSDIFHWEKSGKYLPYWSLKTPYHNRTIDQVVGDIKREYLKFIFAQNRAIDFVKAIAQGNWGAVKLLMGEENGGISDYKKMLKDCQHFPEAKTWQMFASPHTRDNICFIVRISKTKAFTMVVTLAGIKMWRGDEWD